MSKIICNACKITIFCPKANFGLSTFLYFCYKYVRKVKHDMTKTIRTFILALFLFCGGQAFAQARFGYVSYRAVMEQMPEYAAAQAQLNVLRQKYKAEQDYNEEKFHRLFAEFLEGQKDFPEAILLKRQRDLQDAMEKSIAFRHECDSLLKQAEKELMAPVEKKTREYIKKVAREKDYICVFNTDDNALPYFDPNLFAPIPLTHNPE